MKTLEDLNTEYRISEFGKLSRLIMVWVGMPVILFWSVMDYQEWGFKPLWMLIRGTFPIVALGLAKLTDLDAFRGKYRHQIPFVIYTTYILAFCSYFISESGYAQSRYIVGMPQILLSMSFLPFYASEFLLISVFYFLLPVLVASRMMGDSAFFSTVTFQHYVTYSMFAVLTYFVIEFIRRDSFKNKALLPIERETQQRLIEDQAREIAGNRVSVAIAATVQMLAHDVRKPFSILRMALEMLRSVTDLSRLRSVLMKATPEVEKALSSVDGMIADVMEIGSTSNELITESVSPESLIEATLGEIFRVFPKANIELTYAFQHNRMVVVNPQKVGRVFSNIVGNAVQALNLRGGIWFRTRQITGQNGGMVEFCVGNGNSYIPPDHLPKLFDAFFTSGKKGGTGLGLAIAQKVIVAHGGKIWCESKKSSQFPNGQVEFYFTLPAHLTQENQTTALLPKHSSDITDRLAEFFAICDEGKGSLGANAAQIDKGELTLEAEVVQATRNRNRVLRVLIVDDEAVYRSAINAHLLRTVELKESFEMVHAPSAERALASVDNDQRDFDLIITDVDLGAGSANGFELVAALREREIRAMICVHSNRIVAADHKSALISGADAFMPKPIARAQLLRLVLQSIGKSASTPTIP